VWVWCGGVPDHNPRAPVFRPPRGGGGGGGGGSIAAC
jgi:hypothetical protein